MDNKTFASLLAAVPSGGPETHRAYGGAHTADGSLDLEEAASRSAELELACAQAQDYAAATGRLAKVLRWQLQPRRA